MQKLSYAWRIVKLKCIHCVVVLGVQVSVDADIIDGDDDVFMSKGLEYEVLTITTPYSLH